MAGKYDKMFATHTSTHMPSCTTLTSPRCRVDVLSWVHQSREAHLRRASLLVIVILSAVCMLQHIQCQAVSKGTSAGYKPVHGRFLSCLTLMFNLLTCSRTYGPRLINEALTSHRHAWQLSGNWGGEVGLMSHSIVLQPLD